MIIHYVETCQKRSHQGQAAFVSPLVSIKLQLELEAKKCKLSAFTMLEATIVAWLANLTNTKLFQGGPIN